MPPLTSHLFFKTFFQQLNSSSLPIFHLLWRLLPAPLARLFYFPISFGLIATSQELFFSLPKPTPNSPSELSVATTSPKPFPQPFPFLG